MRGAWRSVAATCVDCSPLLAPIFAILPHLGALGRYLGSSWRSQAASCRQVAPRWRPDGPSWPPSWPSWAHLGAKLANLAPSWPILAPRCAPIAMQMEPQMRSKSRPGPAWRQEGHRGPQKCPWSLNFQRFFLEFWTEFDRFFKQLSSISSRRFGTVAAWRAQRTG